MAREITAGGSNARSTYWNFRTGRRCVDYSVAKGGPLVAYRFDGEPQLSAGKFVAT